MLACTNEEVFLVVWDDLWAWRSVIMTDDDVGWTRKVEGIAREKITLLRIISGAYGLQLVCESRGTCWMIRLNFFF